MSILEEDDWKKKKLDVVIREDDTWRFKEQQDFISKVHRSFFNVAYSTRACDTPRDIIWRALFARRVTGKGKTRNDEDPRD